MDARSPTIYAHFLDRELAASVNADLDQDTVVTCLVFSALLGRRVYCSLSAIWEHPSINDRLRVVVRELVAADLLWTVSNHPTGEEFLESRRKQYSFDRRRYPNYFEGPTRPSSRLWTPSQFRPASSTIHLLSALPERIAGAAPHLLIGVQRRLEQRDERAITMALFRRLSADRSDLLKVGQAISFLYSGQYLDWLDAQVLVGVPQLSFFDDLLEPVPTVTSWRLVGALVRALQLDGMVHDLQALRRDAWQAFARAGASQAHELAAAWDALTDGILPLLPPGSTLMRQQSLERHLVDAVRRAADRARWRPNSIADLFGSLSLLLTSAQSGMPSIGTLPSLQPASTPRPTVAAPQPNELPSADVGLTETRIQTKWTRVGAISTAVAAVIALVAALPALVTMCADSRAPSPPTTTSTPPASLVPSLPQTSGAAPGQLPVSTLPSPSTQVPNTSPTTPVP